MYLFAIALSLLFGIVPMVLYSAALILFDRWEKEPPLLMLGTFMWGFFIAGGTAIVLNTVFQLALFAGTGSEGISMLGTAVISAPVIEEALKGLAVLAVFLYFRHEFDSVLDGVIYGSLVGFGFAAAENTSYIFRGFSEGGLGGLLFLAFIRAVVVGFMHATFTSFTGIGLAVSRLNRGPLAWVSPVMGYFTAVTLHAFHNLLGSVGDVRVCLIGSVFDWIGFLGMFAFIVFLVWREGHVLREHLREEVALGFLTPAQYATACSVTGQLGARWRGLTGGTGEGRLYDMCGELAYKKYQLARLGAGSEPAAQATIDSLRARLRGG